MAQGTPHKKSPYSYHFQDGLLDLFIGIIVLQIGIGQLLTAAQLFGSYAELAAFLICLIGYITIIIVWKKVTLPKLSHTAHSPVEKKNVGRFFTVNGLLVLAVLGAAFILSRVPPQQMSVFAQALLRALPIAAALGAAAYFLELGRIFLYAGLVVCLFPLGTYISWITNWPYAYPLAVIGAALFIVTTGLALFIRFIREY